MMLRFELPTCFNCPHLLNEKVLMRQVAEHGFHCDRCGATKELIQYPMLRQRMLFAPGLSVFLMLSFGWTMWKFTEPLVLMLPIPALIAPFVVAGYLYVSLRIILGGVKVEPR